MNTKTKNIVRHLILVLGVFFVGLGIALAKRSGLGVSPVSSVANTVSMKFTVLSVGVWLMIWNCFMIVLQIIILRKHFNPLQLFQFPIALLLGVFTDVCVWAVEIIPISFYIIKLLLVVSGVFVLAAGIALMIVSDTIMNVGEALVKVIAGVSKKDFGIIKIIFDICCVILSVVLSLIFFDFSIVGIREGTVITAFFTGALVKLVLKIFERMRLFAFLENR